MKKGLLAGLMLFGVFFGAGNLIFPVGLGLRLGEDFWQGMSGFILSGVVLAIVALVVGTLNPKGYEQEMRDKFSPMFATTVMIMLYLVLGPFFAIPRTAATAFSVGIDHSHIGLGPLIRGHKVEAMFIFTLIYFMGTYFVSLHPKKVMINIAKYLTPIFTILIASLIIAGGIKYGANMSNPPRALYEGRNAFGTGFRHGYNTFDMLAAVAFSVVVTNTLKELGFKNKKEFRFSVWVASIMTGLMFSFFSIGLAILGNKFPVPEEIMTNDKVNKGSYILSSVSREVFGAFGHYSVVVMIVLTCFTTSVGLMVVTSNFFYKKFPKISYRTYVLIFSLIGFAISNVGLQTVISKSEPALLLMYPKIMCVVLIIIVNKYVPLSKFGMQLTITVVTTLSSLNALANSFNLSWVTAILDKIFLSEEALHWLPPAIVCLIIALFLPNRKKG